MYFDLIQRAHRGKRCYLPSKFVSLIRRAEVTTRESGLRVCRLSTISVTWNWHRMGATAKTNDNFANVVTEHIFYARIPTTFIRATRSRLQRNATKHAGKFRGSLLYPSSSAFYAMGFRNDCEEWAALSLLFSLSLFLSRLRMNKSKVNKITAGKIKIFTGHSLHFLTSVFYWIFNDVLRQVLLHEWC